MMKILKAKNPTQVRFHLGRDERIILKNMKKQTNALFELTSSRKNIKKAAQLQLNVRIQVWEGQEVVFD